MPYDSIADLPDAVKSRYSPRCQQVFVRAFNNAAENGASEADAFKVAHTAAGMCKDSGKADDFIQKLMDDAADIHYQRHPERMRVSKAADLDPDEMQAWFEGKIPRALLAIPFSGPIPGPSGKSMDLDGEYFDQKTDIKPDWFSERPVDWHHSKDPSGKLNGVLIGKAKNLRMDDDGWWVDLWLNAGEKRLSLIKTLAEKGAQLFGSSYAYPNLVKRTGGHIDVWPYMMQTLSTSPQNTNSIHRPAKAVLELFTEADISADNALKAMLAELDVLRDLPATFPLGSEQAAKADAGSDGEADEWLKVLASISDRSKALRSQLVNKPEDVSSTP